MPTTLQAHRARLSSAGLKRVEVKVREGDVPLIRQAARIMASDIGADELRALIRLSLPKPKLSFREWMQERSAS
jgi:hypothetical protein